MIVGDKLCQGLCKARWMGQNRNDWDHIQLWRKDRTESSLQVGLKVHLMKIQVTWENKCNTCVELYNKYFRWIVTCWDAVWNYYMWHQSVGGPAWLSINVIFSSFWCLVLWFESFRDLYIPLFLHFSFLLCVILLR